MGMSREEAIQVLRDWDGCFIGHRSDDVNEALNTAIKALEQEPTTKNNLGVDCVSRQAAIDVLAIGEEFLRRVLDEVDVIGHEREKYEWGLGLVESYISDMEELPSVTPQEPRWIPVSERLPEPFTFVNATCRSLIDDRENWVVETVYLPIPKEVNKHDYSDWGNIPMLNLGEAEVIAWVERIIPQPYIAESAHDVVQDIVKNNGVVEL